MMALLVRIEPEKKMDRWYCVTIQPTLLDPWAVICSWGRRHTGYQRVRVLPADSSEAAEEIAAEVVAQKLRRGYSVRCTDILYIDELRRTDSDRQLRPAFE